MKHWLLALFVSTLTWSPAFAQLAPYNEAGLTMGHWHIAARDVEAEKKLFLAMGGKLYNPGTVPIRHEHVHLWVPAAEVPRAVDWYARVFGGQKATRNNAPVVNLPGVQMDFATAETPQAPTRHRVFEHFGFDVSDHAAFVRHLESMGIMLDQPVGKGTTGNTIAYTTDPWGTRIEIVQRLPVGREVRTN